MFSKKLLIIQGPTATGKTDLALKIASIIPSYIVSADSRQAVEGQDIVTGKDLPKDTIKKDTNIFVSDNVCVYEFIFPQCSLYGYDLVKSQQEMNLSLWYNFFTKITSHPQNANILPIVVGGTGLYIKSVKKNLSYINIPKDPDLRKNLENHTPDVLFRILCDLDSTLASKLNNSDSKNPHRLIRYIEIAKSKIKSNQKDNASKNDILTIGLNASKEYLIKKISDRIQKRIESNSSIEDKFLSSNPDIWLENETKILKKQLTWFKKNLPDYQIDISDSAWHEKTIDLVKDWYYNKPD